MTGETKILTKHLADLLDGLVPTRNLGEVPQAWIGGERVRKSSLHWEGRDVELERPYGLWEHRDGAVRHDMTGSSPIALEAAVDVIQAQRAGGLVSRQLIKSIVFLELGACVGDEARPLDKLVTRKILDALSALPTETFMIARPLQGARLPSSSELQLGPFRIAAWDFFSGTEATTAFQSRSHTQGEPPTLVASVEVQAKDVDRAQELADARFRILDSALRYMVADFSIRRVSSGYVTIDDVRTAWKVTHPPFGK